MPNWGAYVLEPVMTAVIVFAIALLVALLASGGLGYLPIALFVGTFFPLILAFPWGFERGMEERLRQNSARLAEANFCALARE